MTPTAHTTHARGVDSSSSLPYLPPMESSAQILDELFGTAPHAHAHVQVAIAPLRALKATDLGVLSISSPSKPRDPIQQLRTSHHKLAQLIADGVPDTEASLITGRSVSYIKSLREDDPSFKDLVSFYKEKRDAVFSDLHERLHSLATDSIDILHERVLEEGMTMKIVDLLATATLTLDRAGYGPKSTINHKGAIAILSDETLRRIKDEAEQRRLGSAKLLPGSSGPLDCGPVLDAEPVAREAPSEGEQGGRPGVRAEVHSDGGEETGENEVPGAPPSVDGLLR